MPNIALSEARVKALRPRPSTYDIRDAKLKGFGVRVLRSGAKRFFIHAQHRGTRAWKIVGDASAITVDEARARAASLPAAIRCDTDAPVSTDATRFETFAEAVLQRYSRVWKPNMVYVNRHYLHRQILPGFAGTQIADITRADVQRWFASLRATPVAADRSMPVLSVILKEAERMSYRPEGSNPCRGIRRYRRKGRERYPSDAEIGRLAVRLAAHEGERPLHVAAVRLLLLTGCRKSEVNRPGFTGGFMTREERAMSSSNRYSRRSGNVPCAWCWSISRPIQGSLSSTPVPAFAWTVRSAAMVVLSRRLSVRGSRATLLRARRELESDRHQSVSTLEPARRLSGECRSEAR